MKRYSTVPSALLTIIVVSVTMAAATIRPAPHASRPRAGVPVTVVVGVTPRRLIPLDTATIAATFTTVGPDSGPYTATLELRPRAGGPVPTAIQSGFRLHTGQPLTVYWEWRAGATLPHGLYTVWVLLRDVHGNTVTSGGAAAPLLVAEQAQGGG